jgi:hypothetical protein
MEVISREAAKAAGLKFFFTGKPCRNGHDVERYVSTGKCLDCRSSVKKTYYQKNTEKVLSANRTYKTENPDKCKSMYNAEYSSAYYAANREACLKRERQKDPKISRERVRKWKQDNPDKRAAQRGTRRAIEKNAVPKWLTKEHRSQIAAIYAEARRRTKETGVPHHVDHIIPLSSKEVCGLHVPWNLRAIPAEENIRKSNKVVGL